MAWPASPQSTEDGRIAADFALWYLAALSECTSMENVCSTPGFHTLNAALDVHALQQEMAWSVSSSKLCCSS